MQCYVGTSGFAYWHWRGLFYPVELTSNKWFEYYAKYFNTVEINATFYRWPRESTIVGWREKASRVSKLKGKAKQGKAGQFLFTLKANQEITHIKKLKNVKKLLQKFYSLAKLLDKSLGCVLFQLPPSFKYSDAMLRRLKTFLSCLQQDVVNVIEFRHSSWWNDQVYELLRQYNIVFCAVSAPSLPEQIVKTSDVVYVRFHGKKWYRYDYSKEELQQWVIAIKNLKPKPKQLFCYFNNDFNAYAVRNAITLEKLLRT